MSEKVGEDLADLGCAISGDELDCGAAFFGGNGGVGSALAREANDVHQRVALLVRPTSGGTSACTVGQPSRYDCCAIWKKCPVVVSRHVTPLSELTSHLNAPAESGRSKSWVGSCSRKLVVWHPKDAEPL